MYGQTRRWSQNLIYKLILSNAHRKTLKLSKVEPNKIYCSYVSDFKETHIICFKYVCEILINMWVFVLRIDICLHFIRRRRRH